MYNCCGKEVPLGEDYLWQRRSCGEVPPVPVGRLLCMWEISTCWNVVSVGMVVHGEVVHIRKECLLEQSNWGKQQSCSRQYLWEGSMW